MPFDFSVADAALYYKAKGWCVIPIPYGQKSPTLRNWPKLRLSEAEIPAAFSQPCNVGVLLGEPSGWLVDVDLDHLLALKLAPFFLPSTGAIFGRKSKPASHMLYVCPGAKSAKWFFSKKEALTVLGEEKETMLLEMRSTGCQTIFPPSIHPSGETIEWGTEGEPAQVSVDELAQACSKLAAATLMALAWPAQGSRQETALALAGALLRVGWTEEETRQFIEAVAQAVGDEETPKRAETAVYTAKKLGQTPTTGWPRLAELVGEEVTRKLREWLGVQAQQEHQQATPVRLWSAEELVAAEFPDQTWLVPELLPEGGVVLLAGKPKVGKSWLALDIACGLSAGTQVCGLPVSRRAKVLYLALEDTPRRLQARLRHARFTVAGDALFATAWPRLNQGGLERLRAVVQENGVSVVIIDTLAKVRGQRDARRVVSIYDEDYASLEGLKAIADELGITVIVVHHLRKASSNDPVEEVSGTTGLTGAVDSILVLRRGRGEADATLFLTGRDCEERELALRFDKGRWQVLGDAEEYALTKERRELLQAIQALGGAARPKEIAELLGKNHNTVKVLLRKLQAERLVTSVGGRYCIATVYTNSVNCVNSVNLVNSVNPVNRINPVYGHKPPVNPAEPYSEAGSGDSVYAVYAVYANEHKPDTPHQPENDHSGEVPTPEDFGDPVRGRYSIRYRDEGALLEAIRQAEIQGDQENLRRLVEEYQALLRQRGEVTQ